MFHRKQTGLKHEETKRERIEDEEETTKQLKSKLGITPHLESGFRCSALNSITIPRSGASPTFFTVWITGGLKPARSGTISLKIAGSPSGHCWRRVRINCTHTSWLWLCLGRVPHGLSLTPE